MLLKFNNFQNSLNDDIKKNILNNTVDKLVGVVKSDPILHPISLLSKNLYSIFDYILLGFGVCFIVFYKKTTENFTFDFLWSNVDPLKDPLTLALRCDKEIIAQGLFLKKSVFDLEASKLVVEGLQKSINSLLTNQTSQIHLFKDFQSEVLRLDEERVQKINSNFTTLKNLISQSKQYTDSVVQSVTDLNTTAFKVYIENELNLLNLKSILNNNILNNNILNNNILNNNILKFLRGRSALNYAP